jgi:hypothetical protein
MCIYFQTAFDIMKLLQLPITYIHICAFFLRCILDVFTLVENVMHSVRRTWQLGYIEDCYLAIKFYFCEIIC